MTFQTIAEARAYGKAHPEDAEHLRHFYEDIKWQHRNMRYKQGGCHMCRTALAAAEAAEQAKLSTNTTREKP